MAFGLPEMQRCAALPDGSERLRCYDAVSRSMGIPTAGGEESSLSTQAGYGKWTLRNEAGKNGDAPSVFAYTYSENPLPSLPGVKPLLVARCYQGVTEFFIEINESRISKDEKGVVHGLEAVAAGQEKTGDDGIIVIGADAPSAASRDAKAKLTYGNGMTVDVYLSPSKDNTAWFFPNPVSFISQVRRSAKISIEGISLMPPGKMAFDMDGFTNALAPLRASCSW